MHEPKILLWDIENTHNIVAKFGLHEEYINCNNILQETYIVCAAWRWLGEKKTHAVSVLDNPKLYKRDPHNDLHVLKTLHGVLSEADVIVAHNGDKFDIKVTEGRMLLQGLPPLPPIHKIDTLKTVRKRFKLNANNLDYLGKVLGVGRKIKTAPGLWLEVLKGNQSAIKKMVAYNKQDVDLLEKVFLKLRPYMPNYVNRELLGLAGCSRCGSKTQKRGVSRNATRSYQRFQCQDCGGWSRSLKAEPASAKTRAI